MKKFYQVYGSWKPCPSGGWFAVSQENFVTKQEAEIEIVRIGSQETIQIGSGVYPAKEISLWAQGFSERDGRIWIEFT